MQSRGEDSVQFGVLGTAFLFFADDVVLLASSDRDLQLRTGWLAAKCEDPLHEEGAEPEGKSFRIAHLPFLCHELWIQKNEMPDTRS